MMAINIMHCICEVGRRSGCPVYHCPTAITEALNHTATYMYHEKKSSGREMETRLYCQDRPNLPSLCSLRYKYKMCVCVFFFLFLFHFFIIFFCTLLPLHIKGPTTSTRNPHQRHVPVYGPDSTCTVQLSMR
jgi:hypothetical protein